MAEGGGPVGDLYACGRPKERGRGFRWRWGPERRRKAVNLETRTVNLSGEAGQPNGLGLRPVLDWATICYVDVNVLLLSSPSPVDVAGRPARVATIQV